MQALAASVSTQNTTGTLIAFQPNQPRCGGGRYIRLYTPIGLMEASKKCQHFNEQTLCSFTFSDLDKTLALLLVCLFLILFDPFINVSIPGV